MVSRFTCTLSAPRREISPTSNVCNQVMGSITSMTVLNKGWSVLLKEVLHFQTPAVQRSSFRLQGDDDLIIIIR